jgi:hypothetical protein
VQQLGHEVDESLDRGLGELEGEHDRELLDELGEELRGELQGEFQGELREGLQGELQGELSRNVELAILRNFELFSSYSPTLDALLVFVRIFILMNCTEYGFNTIVRLVYSPRFSPPSH